MNLPVNSDWAPRCMVCGKRFLCKSTVEAPVRTGGVWEYTFNLTMQRQCDCKIETFETCDLERILAEDGQTLE